MLKTLKSYRTAGKSRLEYDLDVANEIIEHFHGKPKIIVLAGFMHILSKEFLEMFEKDSVINLHPALPGCFDGANAIPRALEAYHKGHVKHTGVMIHRCIPEVDRGTVIVEQVVEIKENDTLQTLEDRIHDVEHTLIVQGTGLALMLANQKY